MQIQINLRLIEAEDLDLDASAGYTSKDIEYLRQSTETPDDSWALFIEVQKLMELSIPSKLKTVIIEIALSDQLKRGMLSERNSRLGIR